MIVTALVRLELVWAVNRLTIVFIISLSLLIGAFVFGLGSPDSLCAGTVVEWLWWSIGVPRWRDSVKRRGADEDRTQRLAQITGLVWLKGFFLETTEFRPQKKE